MPRDCSGGIAASASAGARDLRGQRGHRRRQLLRPARGDLLGSQRPIDPSSTPATRSSAAGSGRRRNRPGGARGAARRFIDSQRYHPESRIFAIRIDGRPEVTNDGRSSSGNSGEDRRSGDGDEETGEEAEVRLRILDAPKGWDVSTEETGRSGGHRADRLDGPNRRDVPGGAPAQLGDEGSRGSGTPSSRSGSEPWRWGRSRSRSGSPT